MVTCELNLRKRKHVAPPASVNARPGRPCRPTAGGAGAWPVLADPRSSANGPIARIRGPAAPRCRSSSISAHVTTRQRRQPHVSDTPEMRIRGPACRWARASYGPALARAGPCRGIRAAGGTAGARPMAAVPGLWLITPDRAGLWPTAPEQPVAGIRRNAS